jgi:hypothetical protein
LEIIPRDCHGQGLEERLFIASPAAKNGTNKMKEFWLWIVLLSAAQSREIGEYLRQV